MGVDEMGVDKMEVDVIGVDEMGTYRKIYSRDSSLYVWVMVDCHSEDARFWIPCDMNIQEEELPFIFHLHCELYGTKCLLGGAGDKATSTSQH